MSTNKKVARRAAVLTAAVALALPLTLTTAVPVSGAPAGDEAGIRQADRTDQSATSSPVALKPYDLGVREFDEPLEGQFSKIPVRLWGVVAAPSGPGPYPVVVIAHGRHGDNCPVEDDVDTWPCWDQEQRNDLGFAYLARQLASRGVVVVVPDVNAAYTGGWGEAPRMETRRFNEILDSTLDAIGHAAAGDEPFAGLNLTGRVDTTQIAMIGHSRGGYNVIGWAKEHPEVRSLLLVAPVWDHTKLPDLPVAVTIGTCDGDTMKTGLKYVTQARRNPDRTARLVTLTVKGANHNNYNRTLSAKHIADPSSPKGCGPRSQARPAAQQAWLAKVSIDYVRATLLQPSQSARYLKRGGPRKVLIEGLATRVHRYPARRGTSASRSRNATAHSQYRLNVSVPPVRRVLRGAPWELG